MFGISGLSNAHWTGSRWGSGTGAIFTDNVELLPTSFRDLGVFWGSLQPSVKQLEWESAPPIPSPWFSLGKKWHAPYGSGRVSAISGGVKVSWGLIHEWGKDGWSERLTGESVQQHQSCGHCIGDRFQPPMVGNCGPTQAAGMMSQIRYSVSCLQLVLLFTFKEVFSSLSTKHDNVFLKWKVGEF